MTTPPSDRWLVTAGPTHEPIDAVRYLANRSSGRMGIALATAAAEAGHPTTLLLGPTPLEPPVHSRLRVERFRSTADLQAALTIHWPSHDVLLMAAAVADYRPAETEPTGKIRRNTTGLNLRLEPTPDLVADLAATRRPEQRIIAFALEPAAELLEAAAAKMARKGVDAIVANPLETMDAASVTATLLRADGSSEAAPRDLPKADFARWLVNRVERLSEPTAAG